MGIIEGDNMKLLFVTALMAVSFSSVSALACDCGKKECAKKECALKKSCDKHEGKECACGKKHGEEKSEVVKDEVKS